jgi:hypothetical protein
MKIIQPQREYTHSYYLTAARCNAQSELSVAKLAQQVIETATTHANNLGVGYERLIRDGTQPSNVRDGTLPAYA